ncbi:hypothetical protein [Zoogloea dura]|uniref:Uncharacterized protein n=1 Tax=Zoogloea dura TaxID=2728840 RepID=A0A848G0G3_9RHOO|nr:hypothetical protein [Zoogloea dura]NML24586.1 hypothetical protein [Zoogloea dura]
MSLLQLQGSDGRVHEVLVEWDSCREQWHWVGLQFDFWAYPIAGGDDIDDLNGPTTCFQAEVSRWSDDSGCTVLLTITCPPSGELTEDLFASACLKQLGRFWDLFGELEGAE